MEYIKNSIKSARLKNKEKIKKVNIKEKTKIRINKNEYFDNSQKVANIS